MNNLQLIIKKNPKRIIVCEKSEERREFVRMHYPSVLLTTPEECQEFVIKNSDHGGDCGVYSTLKTRKMV